MKKIIIIGMLCSLISFMPGICKSNNLKHTEYSGKIDNPQVEAQAKALLTRLDEIKSMDKSELSTAQKWKLRKEVLSIKSQLHEVSGGVYLSVGAIIIIILLLILLL